MITITINDTDKRYGQKDGRVFLLQVLGPSQGPSQVANHLRYLQYCLSIFEASFRTNGTTWLGRSLGASTFSIPSSVEERFTEKEMRLCWRAYHHIALDRLHLGGSRWIDWIVLLPPLGPNRQSQQKQRDHQRHRLERPHLGSSRTVLSRWLGEPNGDTTTRNVIAIHQNKVRNRNQLVALRESIAFRGSLCCQQFLIGSNWTEDSTAFIPCEQGRCAPWNSVAQRIKKQRKSDNSGDDVWWMLDCFELCLVVARVKHSLTSDLWLSNNILSL